MSVETVSLNRNKSTEPQPVFCYIDHEGDPFGGPFTVTHKESIQSAVSRSERDTRPADRCSDGSKLGDSTTSRWRNQLDITPLGLDKLISSRMPSSRPPCDSGEAVIDSEDLMHGQKSPFMVRKARNGRRSRMLRSPGGLVLKEIRDRVAIAYSITGTEIYQFAKQQRSRASAMGLGRAPMGRTQRSIERPNDPIRN
ncbi:hypothetical protein B9Z19DRAFT_1105405 [Tuber borchii]|uniref:Uncharacterized protein n=1 Tax=Tuber borchii TaxID=42251 RepID=A0A2T7A5J3_TUBBO|nr:hypothetical protein B9Z19DRAFT_1105405 [Tuber borchii]